MKERIEYASKVIGLIIVASSIVSAIYFAYSALFVATDYYQLNKLADGFPAGGNDVMNFLGVSAQIERQQYIKFLILSLLPIPFGIYMMNSDNIFVSYCCPTKSDFDPTDYGISEFDDIREEENNISADRYEEGIGYGRCPDCNAELIRRQVEHGKHTGKLILSCSNFPLCKKVLPYQNGQAEVEEPFKL